MSDETILYLVSPGPRPAFYKIAAFLWGADADFDSDGNSEYPEDTSWTALTLTLRSQAEPRVDIDPVTENPLVLKITSDSADLVTKTAAFLQSVSGGTVSETAPDGRSGRFPLGDSHEG